MAKRGVDPASWFSMTSRGDKTFFRKAHNAGNTVLNARRQCVKDAMKGHHYGDAAAVHVALAQASRACASRYPGRGSR